MNWRQKGFSRGRPMPGRAKFAHKQEGHGWYPWPCKSSVVRLDEGYDFFSAFLVEVSDFDSFLSSFFSSFLLPDSPFDDEPPEDFFG